MHMVRSSSPLFNARPTGANRTEEAGADNIISGLNSNDFIFGARSAMSTADRPSLPATNSLIPSAHSPTL
ncbi:hypothetical protein AB1N83_004031 [Pleurotus pulmonarius]